MRKMVLEISETEIEKLPNMPVHKIKSNEILRLLRFTDTEFAAVMRIEFKDPSFKIEDMLSYTQLTKTKVEILEQDKNGELTYFVKGELPKDTKQQQINSIGLSFGGYFLTPLEVMDGKIRMTFLGKPKQLKALLATFDNIGLQCKVVLMTEASFSPSAPLSCLTQKQREVLVTSFNEGYYDVPRRIGSQELARKLGLKSSALIEHRRKAERRLIASILNKS
jgi:predicted DNA binding protein